MSENTELLYRVTCGNEWEAKLEGSSPWKVDLQCSLAALSLVQLNFFQGHLSIVYLVSATTMGVSANVINLLGLVFLSHACVQQLRSS